MPRFLALYTADKMSPPTPELMQQMGALMERHKKAGKLVTTGGLKNRAADGLSVRVKNGQFNVVDVGPLWASATGWAILEAPNRDQLIADVKEFLALAGDGVSEIIEISDMSQQQR